MQYFVNFVNNANNEGRLKIFLLMKNILVLQIFEKMVVVKYCAFI